MKKSDQNEDDAVNELLDQLTDLQITVAKTADDQEEKVNLQCEIMKRRDEHSVENGGTNESRIETTDVTSV